MALPDEKVKELKHIVDQQLSQVDIHSLIRDIFKDKLEDGEELSEENLMEALQEQGIIDSIMANLHFKENQDPEPKKAVKVMREPKLDMKNPKKVAVHPARRYLHVQVHGGRAFLEHLDEPHPLPGAMPSMFSLYINFRGQRFMSRPVPCACEPDFNEGFMLELHKEKGGDACRMADLTTLLSLCDPVHVVIVKTDAAGDTHLVSSHYMEWRKVLTSHTGRCKVAVELMGIGTESKVSVGVLEVTLEILPKTDDQVAQDVLEAQINLEKTKQAERERLFLVYAKQWWKEYLQIRPGNGQRLVKIFAQDENATSRPVCSYVRPLRVGRLLETPRQAARFVSLLGYERAPVIGGGDKGEIWSSMHAFMCRNKGDCEDHSVLLCSILLGFGQDAYVCIGTKGRHAHSWVVTLAPDGLATFWESLAGHRYVHQPINPDDPPAVAQPKPQYPYRTIGCLFNHQSFYANNQVRAIAATVRRMMEASDNVEVCQFNLNSESHWKAMSMDAIGSVCGPGASPQWSQLPPLCAPVTNPTMVANELEQELRSLVTLHRRVGRNTRDLSSDRWQDQGLTTIWDDQLSYLLSPALAAYEMERVTGINAGNEEFQHAVRRAIPDGHTFKGYPLQFSHRNARRAFAACLKAPICDEIINCRGDHVRLAGRVHVYAYPESAFAVWLMFACKYKSVL